jgi:hypothetical protein
MADIAGQLAEPLHLNGQNFKQIGVTPTSAEPHDFTTNFERFHV